MKDYKPEPLIIQILMDHAGKPLSASEIHNILWRDHHFFTSNGQISRKIIALQYTPELLCGGRIESVYVNKHCGNKYSWIKNEEKSA